MITVRDQAGTSIESYRAFGPLELGKRQFTIFAFIMRHNPVSNKDLAELTGWPISSITPRVKELRDAGLVIGAGERWDEQTHRHENTWKPAPPRVWHERNMERLKDRE